MYFSATDIELFLQEDQELINVTENCQIDRQLGKIYLTLKLVPKTLQEKETVSFVLEMFIYF